MKAESDAPTIAELDFGTAVAAGYWCVFGSWTFQRLAALPFLLSLAVLMLQGPVVENVPSSGIVFGLLDLAPFAILGVLLNRAKLREAKTDLLSRPLIVRPMLLYLVYATLLLAIVFIPVLVAWTGAFVLAYSRGGPGTRPVGWWYDAAWAVPLLLSFYAAARFSLVLPAVCLGRKLGLTGAWNLSRDNSLTLFGIFLAIYIPLGLVGLLASLVFGFRLSTGFVYGIELWPTLRFFLWYHASHIGLALTWTTISFVGFGLATGSFASAYVQLHGVDGMHERSRTRLE